MPDRPPRPRQSLRRSFACAWAGLVHLAATQRNFRIHLLLAVVAAAAGYCWRIEPGEWLALVLTFALVIATEAVNTAIEAVVDLVQPDQHPQARLAKDIAAAAVLLASVFAVIIGGILFGPRLWRLWSGS